MRDRVLTPTPEAFSRGLWLLLALLFVAPRVGLLVVQLGRPLAGDELSYNQIARNVSAGHGFSGGEGSELRTPTAARGPSYILLVAAFDAVFGADRTPLFAFQILLDAMSLLLLVRLARRWFGSWWIAWWAGVLYSTYPPIITSTVAVLTEPMTILTLLLWVTLFVEYYETRRTRDLVLASLALGVCALGKPQIALFGPVACLAALPLLRPAGTVRAIILVTAVVTLTMSPWIARNALVFRTFVPGVSIGGLGVLFGSGAFDGRTVGALDHPAVPDSVRRAAATMDEVELNRWATREAVRTIREHPGRYAKISALKIPRLWFNLGFDEGRPSPASLFVAAFNLVAVLLAFAGARLAVDRVAPRLVGFGAIFWTLVHIPFFANVRYAVPFLVLVFVFTAAGLVVMTRGFRKPRPV